jgi:hypothetical protein
VFSFPFDDKSGRKIGWIFEIDVLFVHRHISLLNTGLLVSASFRHLQTPAKLNAQTKKKKNKQTVT